MKLHNETSLSAYILFQEVVNELNIKETIEESKKNGNIKKIISQCNNIIDRRYTNDDQKSKLKTHIQNIFMQN